MTQSDTQTRRHDDPASILVISDTAQGERRCRIAVEAIGARVVSTAGPADAVARIGEQIALDAALVDLAEDHGAALDTLFGEIDRGARSGRYRSIVSVPIELLDIADAQVRHGDIALLCAPKGIEQAAALGLAVANRSLALQDIGREHDDSRLMRLSEEVARIARALAELSHDDRGKPNGEDSRLAEAPLAFRPEPARTDPLRPEDIRAMIRMRRLRDRFFDSELFADPAWDMLLDLMAARLEGRQVAVSSLCIAAAVPPTTALRWIRTMTDRGLFERRSDPRDGRRVFIDLADEAAEALERWFAAVQQNGDLLPG
ncbi:winged helix DNA-binding protein [Parasphingopyxis algicola]|uniref:winged helix DNA-binding protein n=1 Tax=Parasphingopyxis algicola TaxID=2026624 RepID=UPI0015A029C0|nr:winged helix DNA-binding protein [Parasphingopyxis algicola]QLC23613.1 winged helix DNA-binding protein [Parasphingopyxis algicola]